METSWNIRDYHNQSIKNSITRHGHGTSSLAVIFPGFRYPPEAPLFFYILPVLDQLGFDALSLDYRYNENNSYLQSSDVEKTEWLKTDALAIYHAICEQSQYRNLVFIGKSLGTTAMMHILDAGLKHQAVGLIWLTPAGRHQEIARYLNQTELPSLYIQGSADSYYSPHEINSIKTNHRVSIKLFESAGHQLEIAGDSAASLDNLKQAVKAMENFLRTP